MTQAELDELDASLAASAISGDEYADTLRSEVRRLHPEYDQCEIDNMFRLQLRSEALEDTLVGDSDQKETPEQCSIAYGEAPAREDADAEGLGPSPNNEEENARHAKCEPNEQREDGGNQEQRCDSGNQNGDRPSEGGRGRPGDDGQKDDKENSRGGGPSRRWDTYMIVPGWVQGIPDTPAEG